MGSGFMPWPSEHWPYVPWPLNDRAAVGLLIHRRGHLIAVVIPISPRLGQSALALLDEISFVIVSVRPGGVVGQLISRAGLVGGVGAIAVEIIAVSGRTALGQLVGGVVFVADRRAG